MDCSIVQMLHCLRFASQLTLLGVVARGKTPLHEAASWGQVEVVKLLLEAKALVTVKGNRGRGPRLGDVMAFCFPCGCFVC